MSSSPPPRVQYYHKPVSRDEERDDDEEAAVWFCVFLYLDSRELCVAGQVCRAWRDISRHPALWRRVVLEGDRITSKVNTHTSLEAMVILLVHSQAITIWMKNISSSFLCAVCIYFVQFLRTISKWCSQLQSLKLNGKISWEIKKLSWGYSFCFIIGSLISLL